MKLWGLLAFVVNISYVLIGGYKFLARPATVVLTVGELRPAGIGRSKAWRLLTYRLYDVCANIFQPDGIDTVATLGPLRNVMV